MMRRSIYIFSLITSFLTIVVGNISRVNAANIDPKTGAFVKPFYAVPADMASLSPNAKVYITPRRASWKAVKNSDADIPELKSTSEMLNTPEDQETINQIKKIKKTRKEDYTYYW